jgi:hypothetical protein
MTIIGDSVSFANVNQLPHCDDTREDGRAPKAMSHFMALPEAEGENATLGIPVIANGVLKSCVVQFRHGKIISFNGVHFGTGGSGDSTNARVHCYTGERAIPSEYDASTCDVVLPPLQHVHCVTLRACRT